MIGNHYADAIIIAFLFLLLIAYWPGNYEKILAERAKQRAADQAFIRALDEAMRLISEGRFAEARVIIEEEKRKLRKW